MALDTSYQFLLEIKSNNNREWFGKNKDRFLAAQEEVKTFVSDLIALMKTHDHIDEGLTKIYRIYKDVRFSKDKTPYKTNWSANIKRATTQLRGGYYLQIEPGNTFLAGGFFGPNAADLLHIRKHLLQDARPLRQVMDDASFSKYFGGLQGGRVKSAPKGFSKDAENIDLIRYKSFYFHHYFTDQELLDSNFVEKVSEGFKQLRPYFDVMSEWLNTDHNGEPLI